MNKPSNVSDGTIAVNRVLPEIDLENLSDLSKAILAEVEPALCSNKVGQRCVRDRAHVIAIKNWLGKHRPSASASGPETIRGYQEAYHHLREIGVLHQALMVKRVSLRIRKAVARQRWQRFEEEQRRE